MNKKRLIAFLMANAVTVVNGVTLSDNMPEDHLAKLTDEHLENELKEVLKKAKETPKKEEPKAEAANIDTPPAAPKKDDAPKVVTMQEYVNAAPPEIREVLANGVNLLAQKKGSLVTEILGNKANRFSKEYLEARSEQELECIADLARVPAANTYALSSYGGQAPTPTTTNAPKPKPHVPKKDKKPRDRFGCIEGTISAKVNAVMNDDWVNEEDIAKKAGLGLTRTRGRLYLAAKEKVFERRRMIQYRVALSKKSKSKAKVRTGHP